MLSKTSWVFLWVVAKCLAILEQNHKLDFHGFTAADIIVKDVAIIGGGSAGTYSAISLKDKGFSVVVVEKKDRIGGNTETYIDPATGTPVDIGVATWHNISIVTDYFRRFGIPLVPYGTGLVPGAVSQQYDFTTGALLNLTFPSIAEEGAAFAAYAQILEEKYQYLDDGMFLPKPVPAELLEPFGDFVQKHNISAVLNLMFELDPALGNFTSIPTVERMKTFSSGLVEGILKGDLLTTARHNNSELYTRAQAELLQHSSLLLQSEVVEACREDGIRLVVQTLEGKKLIKAKRLLMTIPPKLDILKPFRPSPQERKVFSRFINVGYYTSILKNTGIPDSLGIFNYNPDTPFYFPTLPGTYNVQATAVKGLHVSLYGTPRGASSFPMSDDAVKADIIKAIKTVQKANPDKFKQTEPEFVVFSSHTPFELQARPEDIRNGFYAELYALQGLQDTYWSSASFRAQDSSAIWKFSEKQVLPNLVKGL